MRELEALVGLVLAAVMLAAAARRVGAPYPALLALGGAVLAFVPGAPSFTVPPELALALFVAPVLLDAAFDASPRDHLVVRHARHRHARGRAALPAGFPFRNLIVFTAFAVVLGTLVLQGLTLKPLLLALDLRDDDPVGQEVSAARERPLRAALAQVQA